MQRLYESLGEKLHQRPTTLFVQGYWNVCDLLRPADLDQVAAWADKEADNGKYPAIAREIAAAASRSTDYYLSILRDENLPSTWRTSVAWSLFERHKDSLSRELILECAKVYTEALTGNAIIPPQQSPPIVSALLTLERDDQWKEVALALAKAWNKRLVLKSATRGVSLGFSISATTRREPLEILKMLFLLDQETTAVQFIQTYEKVQYIANDPSLIGLLVASGRESMAARMFRSRWNQFKFGPNEPAIFYDRRLHERMPGFLKSLPTEDMRFLAEVLLVSLPDSPIESERHTASRSSRLESVAKRFSTIKFSDEIIRRRALLWLSSDLAARQHVRKPLAEVAGETDLLKWMTGDSSFTGPSQTLAARHLVATLQTGDPKPLTEMLARIDAAKDVQSYRKGSVLSDCSDDVVAIAKQQWPTWTVEQIAGMRPITRRLAKYTNWQKRRAISELNIVAHAFADDMKGFRKWHNSLSDDERKGMRYVYGGSEIWPLVAKMLGKPTPENLDDRIKIAGALIDGYQQLGHIESSGDEIILRESGPLAEHIFPHVLTHDEFLHHGPRLSEQSPANGFAWALLAGEQTNAGQFKNAVESWNHAYTHAADDDKLRKTTWRSNEARVLKHLNQ